MTDPEEQWAEMLSDLRGRKKETAAKAKELRQQRKKQRVERAAAEAQTKRREQAERAAARQRASENRKKQPALHRVDREGQGGEFDKQWGRLGGAGFWVWTARPPGRGTKWLGGKAAVAGVHARGKALAGGAIGHPQSCPRALVGVGGRR